jgi:DNA-binding LytR/AlgR family response regulator
MSLSCVIVEDLPVAAAYLVKCCQKSGMIEVLAHCMTVKDAVAFLRKKEVDLIFLDVEMPEGHGFDVLDNITYSSKVILTTSKTEYAYSAFEYNVTDFLKKPFTYQRFMEAVQKVPGSDTATQKEIPGEDHIFVKSDGKLVRLKNDEIFYIESMGDYVKFVAREKNYIVLNTIKNLETKINSQFFMKVHRSYIINTSKVDNIHDNRLFIKGSQIPVSKAFKADVARRFNSI